MTRGNTAAAASARSARGYGGGGGGGGGGPGQVFGSAEPANQYASQYVRAIAMPRTCVLLLLLLLSCAGCARAAAATAATVVSPPSFRSANLTAAGLLAATKYGKTVLAGDEITVAAQEYADCVVFRVQARTRGYVALGFVDPIASSVDVLLAWVDDDTGTGHVMDMHGKTETGLTPEKDVSQDYELLASFQNGSHISVVFRRAWDTCDAHDDVVFGNDTMRMFWTMSDRDPIDRQYTDALKLGSSWKGTQSFHPKGPKFEPTTDNYKRWDVTMDNLRIKDDVDTLYWCKIFKAPIFKKNHIVGFVPLLNDDTRHLIHHMIVYECYGGSDIMEKYVTLKGAQCYGQGMPDDWNKCVSPVVTWAMGSDGQFLPDHIGVPIGGRELYYMLEVHYDNPTLKKVMDNSGVRVYYTDVLRPNDAGIMAVGMAVSPMHIVPPKQVAYKTASLCDKDCTNVIFPERGIKITSVLLHAHMASRQLKLRHVRHDQEMATIAQDDRYDYDYQQARELSNEVTVYPGDELITECVYNTVDRPHLTHGGYSTKQEMCLAFVTYYPRTPLASCFSMTPVPFFFETFGVQQFLDYNMEGVEKIFLKLADSTTKNPPSQTTTTTTTVMPALNNEKMLNELNQAHIAYLMKPPSFTIDDGNEHNLFRDLEIMEPVEFQNKTFQQHLDNLPWEDSLLTKNIERRLINGKHMTFCRLHNDTLALMMNTYLFPNFTAYAEPKTSTVGCVPLSNKFKNSAFAVQSSYVFILLSIALIYVF